MNKSEDLNKLFSGTNVAKNTIYNLFGYGIPLLVAVALIPLLIKGLGEEKFGILSLCWVVIGYFSFLDFGIGRALTKIVAEKIGLNKTDEIPGFFWTSIFIMLAVSSVLSIVLIIFTPSLVSSIFNISKELHKESINTFYVLAASVPIVATTAGLRGVLEAYQKFGLINIIRINLGIFTFLAPLLCLILTNSLFWIVISLSAIRIIVWIVYLFQCFKVNERIKINKIRLNSSLIKLVFRLSGWMTVSNIVGPLMIHLDRFLIGALISATAVTFYATPYEVVTKLLLIPGALTAVLFPAFSTNYIINPDHTRKLFLRGIKFVFIFLFPIVLLLVTFANEGIVIWLGSNFAEKSTLVMQLLAVGVLLNSIAYIPFAFLQGIGKPEIPSLINLIELPFYIAAIWFAITQWGIKGAALVWLIRIVLDTGALLFISNKISSFHLLEIPKFMLFLCLILILTIPFVVHGIYIKLLFVFIVLSIFILLIWKYILLDEEKDFLSRLTKFGQ